MKPFVIPERLQAARAFFGTVEPDEASIRALFLIDELEQCHRWLWRLGLLPGEEFRFPCEAEVLESLMFAALHECSGNYTRASELLGLHRNTLFNRMNRPVKTNGAPHSSVAGV